MLLARRQPDKPAAATNKLCSIRTRNGLYTEFGIDPLYGRNHHIKDDVFQYNLFLPHQARKDTDEEKTHAAKDKIFQAKYHEVDK